LQQVAAELAQDADFDGAAVFPYACQQLREQRDPVSFGHADTNRSGVLDRACTTDHQVMGTHELLRAGQEVLAGGGQPDFRVRPVKQAKPQLVLESSDPEGHGSL
jgi:hypothetical protein